MLKYIVLLGLISTAINAEIIKGLDLRTNKEVEVQIDEKKPTVYYFLSAWCPCSQGTFSHLNKLQRDFPQFNFIGFHSSVVIPTEEAFKYFSNLKIEFPIIQDKEVVFADKFKAVKTPHVFVYSPEGEVLFQGGATNSKTFEKANKFFLKDALTALSKGETPKITNARALGCYIQR